MEGATHNDAARPKRAKVTLACQRCKQRKQKCNGAHPCSKCGLYNLRCEYVVPQKPMPFGKNHYIDSLERRVAELETLITTHGIEDLNSDHWTSSEPRAAALGDGPLCLDPSAPPQSALTVNVTLKAQEEVDPVVSVLRSLSLDANGSGYIGASSHIALGRLFSFLNPARFAKDHFSTQLPHSRLENAESTNIRVGSIELVDLPAGIADRLFTGYLKHVATRFPVLHSPWIQELHLQRHQVTNTFEKSTLHLVYAAAGRFLETTGEAGDFSVRRNYEAAVGFLDQVIAYNDLRTIQTLMLMAIYCLRDSIGVGAWTYSRTALLIAIDHGLHRQTRTNSSSTLQNELRERLFWACYCFDRQISIPMGRPFGISDRDIDLELPLDVNEDSAEGDLVLRREAAVADKSTTLTSFVKIIELRRMESEIQQTIYRVDKATPVDDAVIDTFLARLRQWKDTIPQDTIDFKDADGIPFDGYDYYLVFYHKCQRLLLYPSVTKPNPQLRLLKECAQACAGVCGAYKRLHQSLALGYSSMAVQTVFMAGLTLVYCIWLSPDDIFDITTSNGIHDCSVVLFAIAERVPSVKRYRNTFETIRQRVIDHIATVPRSNPRSVVPHLNDDLPFSAARSDDVTLRDGNYGQWSQIMSDMAGNEWPTGTDELFTAQYPLTSDMDLEAIFGLSEFDY